MEKPNEENSRKSCKWEWRITVTSDTQITDYRYKTRKFKWILKINCGLCTAENLVLAVKTLEMKQSVLKN
jgi:hypothetical protein